MWLNLILSLLLYGCTAITTPDMPAPTKEISGTKAFVLSNHTIVHVAAVGDLKRIGYQIVERQKVESLLGEQRFRLLHTPDNQADALKTGEMLGAEEVIMLETSRSKDVTTIMARGVSVDTGEVL